jgi:general secretion pathway protein D
MAMSGGDATIDVGTEVPIITRQSTSSELQQDGTSAILQEIQYRKTGVLLRVKPVVHSGNRIDLEISQEVSEHQPDPSSNISSPNIFTRKIETSLSLKDGGSVMLGGLISSTTSRGYSGVPVLSKIPILGRLFRVEKETEVRTEMIMLIIPYVIDSSHEAEAVTEAFKKVCPSFGTRRE